MYLRFTVPKEHGGAVTRANIASGPFWVANRLYWQGDRDNDPILIGLKRELEWFNSSLPVPKRFGVRARGVWWDDGVCWFRDDAGDMLHHMEVFIALIEECGVPVTRNWTRDPGQLLYRDRWQVVAKVEHYLLQ